MKEHLASHLKTLALTVLCLWFSMFSYYYAYPPTRPFTPLEMTEYAQGIVRRKVAVKGQIHYADLDQIKRELPRLKDESVDELYEFGTILTGEVSQRTAHLDSKLGSYLGYSAVLLALLGVQSSQNLGSSMSSPIKVALLLSVLSGIASIGFSSYGLWATQWPSPSEDDWFQKDLIDKADRLRRYHVYSILECHQWQQKLNQAKAKMLCPSQCCLAISGVLAAGLLIFRIALPL